MSAPSQKMLYSRETIMGCIVHVYLCTAQNSEEDHSILSETARENKAKRIWYEAYDTETKLFNTPFYVGDKPPSDVQLTISLDQRKTQRLVVILLAIGIGIVLLAIWLNR